MSVDTPVDTADPGTISVMVRSVEPVEETATPDSDYPSRMGSWLSTHIERVESPQLRDSLTELQLLVPQTVQAAGVVVTSEAARTFYAKLAQIAFVISTTSMFSLWELGLWVQEQGEVARQYLSTVKNKVMGERPFMGEPHLDHLTDDYAD